MEKCQRLLLHLSKQNRVRYTKLINQLNIWESINC
ncbi:hypothetical protein Pint_11647 [Pistacia integerrima]|uniref:Uncharacterized protein n=1 Tax=Pistacia integerrima TaxID=434235 RepID=A0ACC0XDP4_9ROSI|nr:hypothetical protein Pint_11647 [Pistacia integerrima]